MSGSEGGSRRTHGKGSRKPGRGDSDDVDDGAESEAAEAAQRTIDEIEREASQAVGNGEGDASQSGGDERDIRLPGEGESDEEERSERGREGGGSGGKRSRSYLERLVRTTRNIERVFGRAAGTQQRRVADGVVEEIDEKTDS